MSMANDLEQLMLNLINQERSNANLAPLTFNNDLNAASEDHSTWMLDTDTFSHTGQGGSSAGDRIVAAGYELEGNWTWGENIGWQSERGDPGLEDDVADIHQSLMNSPGHRANILNPNFEEIGIGVERGDFERFDSVMITQNFGATDAVSDDEEETPANDDTPVAEAPTEDMPENEEPPVEEDPIDDTPVTDDPAEDETPMAEGPDADDPVEEDPMEDEPDNDETPVAEGPETDEPAEEDPPVAEGPDDDDLGNEDLPVADDPDAELPEEEPPVAEAPEDDMPVDDPEEPTPPIAEGPETDDPDQDMPPVAEDPEDDAFDVEMFVAELTELLSEFFDNFDFVASDDCGPDDMVIDMPVEDEVMEDAPSTEDDMAMSCDAFDFEVSVNINFNFDLG